MVKFEVSADIQKIIKEYNKTCKLSEADDGYINPQSGAIEHLQLVQIASTLQSKAENVDKTQFALSHILKSTSLFIPPSNKPNIVCPFSLHALLKV